MLFGALFSAYALLRASAPVVAVGSGDAQPAARHHEHARPLRDDDDRVARAARDGLAGRGGRS